MNDLSIKNRTVFDIEVKIAASTYVFNIPAQNEKEAKATLRNHLEEIIKKLL